MPTGRARARAAYVAPGDAKAKASNDDDNSHEEVQRALVRQSKVGRLARVHELPQCGAVLAVHLGHRARLAVKVAAGARGGGRCVPMSEQCGEKVTAFAKLTLVESCAGGGACGSCTGDHTNGGKAASRENGKCCLDSILQQ